jgi:hypothetical protein
MHSNRAAGKLAGYQTVAGHKRLHVLAEKPAKLHVDLVAPGMKNSTASSVNSAFRSVLNMAAENSHSGGKIKACNRRGWLAEVAAGVRACRRDVASRPAEKAPAGTMALE